MEGGGKAMFLFLTRMETVWDRLPQGLNRNPFQKGKSQIREVIRPFAHLLFHSIEEVSLEQAKDLYQTLLLESRAKCRSVKLYFEGDIPEKELIHMGYIHSTFYRYPHPDFFVAAMPYGKTEWCLMLEKRNGGHVPVLAFDLAPYSPYQLNWEVG